MSTILSHILNNDCPHCHQGKVFKEKSIFFKFSFPKMNEFCCHCHQKFQKEPGYFFGAMYVNYGLTVAQAITTYCIAHFFFKQTFDLRIIPIIMVVIVTLSPLNIRLSRLLWLYMFRNYSK